MASAVMEVILAVHVGQPAEAAAEVRAAVRAVMVEALGVLPEKAESGREERVKVPPPLAKLCALVVLEDVAVGVASTEPVAGGAV